MICQFEKYFLPTVAANPVWTVYMSLNEKLWGLRREARSSKSLKKAEHWPRWFICNAPPLKQRICLLLSPNRTDIVPSSLHVNFLSHKKSPNFQARYELDQRRF